MDLSERNPTLDDSSNIRRRRLWMPNEGLDVIIQVITDDKQNLGFGIRRPNLARGRYDQEKNTTKKNRRERGGIPEDALDHTSSRQAPGPERAVFKNIR